MKMAEQLLLSSGLNEFPRSPDSLSPQREEEAPFAAFPLTMKVLFSQGIPIPASSSGMVSVTVRGRLC